MAGRRRPPAVQEFFSSALKRNIMTKMYPLDELRRHLCRVAAEGDRPECSECRGTAVPALARRRIGASCACWGAILRGLASEPLVG